MTALSLARNSIPLISAVALGLMALGIDLFVLKTPLLAEGHPSFGRFHVFRTALMAASALGFVVAVVLWKQADPSWPEGSRPDPDPVRLRVAPPWLTRAAWFVLLVATVLVALFFYDPEIFYQMAREDRPAEMFSAAGSLIASAVFVLVFFRLRKVSLRFKLLSLGASLAAGLVFFLVGMEELSWFQRFLGIETPKVFSANMEGEINFHNFATDEMENIYYASAFLLLVFLPFLRDKIPSFEKVPLVSTFVPSRQLFFVGAMAFAYNYDMWNVLATQWTFFVPLFILLHYAWKARGPAAVRLLPAALATVYFLTQVALLGFGHEQIRMWDVTEYKEFFIGICFAFYSLEVLGRSRCLVDAQGSRW